VRREQDLGPLRIVYAGPGPGAADRVILRRVEELDRPGEWTVVTSDRALGQACRSRGARWVRAGELRAEMEPVLAAEEEGGEDTASLRPHEVEDWLAWFERQGAKGGKGGKDEKD
jgi:predicted RNA-binding protein with PIN domain